MLLGLVGGLLMRSRRLVGSELLWARSSFWVVGMAGLAMYDSSCLFGILFSVHFR